jgi:hypothetical protein
MLPWGGINCAEVEQIGVGIVAVDFEHFGNETPSWPALDLNQGIEQIANVGLDGVGAIYNVHWSSIFSAFGCNISDFGRDQAMFAPAKTQLVSRVAEADDTVVVPMKSAKQFKLDKTNLLAKLGRFGETFRFDSSSIWTFATAFTDSWACPTELCFP